MKSEEEYGAPHDNQSTEVVAFELLHETRYVDLSVVLVNLISLLVIVTIITSVQLFLGLNLNRSNLFGPPELPQKRTNTLSISSGTNY